MTIHSPKFERVYKTGYEGLGYTRVADGVWQFVMIDPDGFQAQIGEHYPSRRLIEADVRRYAKEQGFRKGAIS